LSGTGNLDPTPAALAPASRRFCVTPYPARKALGRGAAGFSLDTGLTMFRDTLIRAL
jgi:hypothetical protein